MGESAVRKIATDLRTLRDSEVPQLAADLQKLQTKVEKRGTQTGFGPGGNNAQRDAPLESAMAELDKRSSDRLASVWKELKNYADGAATRADQLERNTSSRMDKMEANVKIFMNKRSDESEYVKEKDLVKHLEWLNWRISWLEWATSGEKRSFSRPLDSKAVMPCPPPGTNCAPVFSQPITEDVEMWARQKDGTQRLRRRMPAPNDPGPSAHSRSHGQLPTLRF